MLIARLLIVSAIAIAFPLSANECNIASQLNNLFVPRSEEKLKVISESSKEQIQGAKLLHQLNPHLHLTPEVERSKEILKLLGEKNVQNAEKKIAAWIAVLEQTHSGKAALPGSVEALKRFYRQRHLITESEFPESYFELQRRIARDQGHGDIELTAQMRKQLMDVAIKDQQQSLDKWVEFLISEGADYPMWAKVWAFEGMAKISKINPEIGTIVKRAKDTVAPFVDLNREALKLTIEEMTRFLQSKANKTPYLHANPELMKLVKAGNFEKIYGKHVSLLQPDLTITDGVWVRYPKNSDHTPLAASLDCKNTGWCTAGPAVAESQLKGGDFYVYYSKDRMGRAKQPRLAIRMNGNSIGEVRGVAAHQDVDPAIGKTDILPKKLDEFGGEGTKYLKRDSDMKQLTKIEEKIKQGDELTEAELRFLYEIDSPIEGFGRQKDPRVAKFISLRENNKRKDLAIIYKLREDEISFSVEEALSGKAKIHWGDLYLSGDLDLKGKKVNLPEIKSGELSVIGLTSAPGLKFPHKMDSLSLYSLKSAKGMEFPEEMGSLNLNGLESADGVKFPRKVDSLYLDSLKSAKGIEFPDELVNLNLRSLESADGVKFPRKMDSLDLYSLKSAKGVEFPEEMRSLYLNGLESADGVKFPRKMNSLSLNGLKSAKGMEFPDEMGNLYLNGLESADGVKFPRKVDSLYLDSIKSAKGIEFPDEIGSLYLDGLESVDGMKFSRRIYYLSLDSLKSAKGTEFPDGIVNLSLNGLESVDGVKFPHKMESLSLKGLKSAEGMELPDTLDLLKINNLALLNKIKNVDGIKLIDLSELEVSYGIIELPKKLQDKLKLPFVHVSQIKWVD